MQPKKAIPEKLFFKIGEVCELVEVEPHVLRYWEQEFSQLTPQKNRAGQRVYRRRDVEIAMRIKALREEEGFTIAGAKKRLATEMRSANKLKVVPMERPVESPKEIESEAADSLESVVEASQIDFPPPAIAETLEAMSVEPFITSLPPQVSEPSSAQVTKSLETKQALQRVKADLEALLTMLR